MEPARPVGLEFWRVLDGGSAAVPTAVSTAVPASSKEPAHLFRTAIGGSERSQNSPDRGGVNREELDGQGDELVLAVVDAAEIEILEVVRAGAEERFVNVESRARASIHGRGIDTE
jgi:hypothetical protein